MCIAVVKPAGQNVPSKKTFNNCFQNNSHGAGFMFAYDGKVHIEKGFMSFSAFRKGLKETFKKFHIKDGGKSLSMVFHFRITSQGAVCQELTHPYPLCEDYDEMKKTSSIADFGVAHNGIIDFASSYKITDHNDTMEFIKNVLSPTINGDKKFYKDKKKVDMLEYLLDGNRVVVLDGDGHATLFGHWEVKDGVYYSNTSYSYSRPVYKSTDLKPYSSYYGDLFNDDGYEYYENGIWKKKSSPTTVKELFPEYDDDYDKDDPYYHKASEIYKPLSDRQVSDLYTYGRLQCECGEDLTLQYDEQTDCYIAYCSDCGEIYYLDDDTASFAISQDIGYDDNQDYTELGYDYAK